MAVSLVIITVAIIYLVSFALGAPGNTHILVTFLKDRQMAAEFIHVTTFALAGFLVSVILVPVHVLGRLMNMHQAMPLSWCLFDVMMYDISTLSAVINACLLALHQMLLFSKTDLTSHKYYVYIVTIFPWLTAISLSCVFTLVLISANDVNTATALFCSRVSATSASLANGSIHNVTSQWAVSWSVNTNGVIMLISFLGQAAAYHIILYSARKTLTSVNAIYQRRKTTTVFERRETVMQTGSPFHNDRFRRTRAWSAPDCFQPSITDSQIAICSSNTSPRRDIREMMQSRLGAGPSDRERVLFLPGCVTEVGMTRINSCPIANAGGSYIIRSQERLDDFIDDTGLTHTIKNSKNSTPSLYQKSLYSTNSRSMTSGSAGNQSGKASTRGSCTSFPLPPRLPLPVPDSPKPSSTGSDSVFNHSTTSENDAVNAESEKPKVVTVDVGTSCEDLPSPSFNKTFRPLVPLGPINERRPTPEAGQNPGPLSPLALKVDTSMLQFLNSNRKSLTCSQKINLWKTSVDQNSVHHSDIEEEVSELCCTSLGDLRSVSQVSHLPAEVPSAMPLHSRLEDQTPAKTAAPVAPIVEIRVIRPSLASRRGSVAPNSRILRRKSGKIMRPNYMTGDREMVTEEPELEVEFAKYYADAGAQTSLASGSRGNPATPPVENITEVDNENYDDDVVEVDDIATVSDGNYPVRRSSHRSSGSLNRLPISEQACVEQITVLSASVKCIVARMVLLLLLFLITVVTPSFISMTHLHEPMGDLGALLQSTPFLWMSLLPYTYVYSNVKLAKAMRNRQHSEKYLP